MVAYKRLTIYESNNLGLTAFVDRTTWNGDRNRRIHMLYTLSENTSGICFNSTGGIVLDFLKNLNVCLPNNVLNSRKNTIKIIVHQKTNILKS